LLLPGLTARTEVDERAAHEPLRTPEEETRAAEAGRVHQWLLQQKQQRQQQQQHSAASSLPPAPFSAPSAAPDSIELPADAPSVSRPAAGLNCKQRRAQRRAARSLDKLMATPLQSINEDNAAIPAAGSAATAIARPLTAAAATPTVDMLAMSAAAPSQPVAPAAPAVAEDSAPAGTSPSVVPSLRGHRRKRKHKRQHAEPAEALQRELKRKAHALAAKLPPPRVVRCCTECGTRRRINTKPARAPAATE
jgi:hypothetical protein